VQFPGRSETLANLDQGLRAVLVEVVGKSQKLILRGCTTFRLGLHPDPVTVYLAVTDDYAAEKADSTCTTTAQRHGGRC
jgi:hypothetical protein